MEILDLSSLNVGDMYRIIEHAAQPRKEFIGVYLGKWKVADYLHIHFKHYLEGYNFSCDIADLDRGVLRIYEYGDLPQENMKSDETSNGEKPEVTDFKPSHYSSLPFSVETVQIQTAYNNYIYLMNNGTDEKEAFEKSVWLTYALKHLCRIGLKDDVNLEMKKAENYIHKARTGEWIKDV